MQKCVNCQVDPIWDWFIFGASIYLLNCQRTWIELIKDVLFLILTLIKGISWLNLGDFELPWCCRNVRFNSWRVQNFDWTNSQTKTSTLG